VTLDLDGATVRMLLRAFAAEVAACLAELDDGLIDQRDRRGLMGRRHIEAVRRRMKAKAGGAWKRGRDYLLTPAAVLEELERGNGEMSNDSGAAPARPRKAKGARANDQRAAELAQLKREVEAEMRGVRNR
jgi:hypothetical protein